MRAFRVLVAALATFVLLIATAAAQPPGRRGGPPRGGPPSMPPRFELGKVLPPHVRNELQLTRPQEEAIRKLEAEVKERLAKILTAQQKRKIENLGPPGGFGGPPDGPPDRLPPENDDNKQVRSSGAGIQWFATWESGLAEANRSGRPILLVSAAPHCAGVSGIW